MEQLLAHTPPIQEKISRGCCCHLVYIFIYYFRSVTFMNEIVAVVLTTVFILYILLIKKLRSNRDEEYAKCDAKKDCSFLSTSGTHVEEPLLVKLALEMAIFRTFGVERISKLLHATGLS